eukprot:g35648.t1
MFGALSSFFSLGFGVLIVEDTVQDKRGRPVLRVLFQFGYFKFWIAATSPGKFSGQRSKSSRSKAKLKAVNIFSARKRAACVKVNLVRKQGSILDRLDHSTLPGSVDFKAASYVGRGSRRHRRWRKMIKACVRWVGAVRGGTLIAGGRWLASANSSWQYQDFVFFS